MQLNELEVQNIRHFVGGHQTIAAKYTQYANSCNDPQLKQMLLKGAQEAQNSAQKLLSFLG